MRICPSILVLSAALAAAGCDGEPPRRDCTARVWVSAAYPDARVVGSWNGWAEPGVPFEPFDAQWQLARLELPAGEHGYLITYGGSYWFDPANPLTTFREEEEVSLLLVSDCAVPRIAIDAVQASEQGELSIAATFLAAHTGEPLATDTVGAHTLAGAPLEVTAADPDSGAITAHISGLPKGKHTVVLTAADDEGVHAEPVRAVGWVSPGHTDWRDGVLYQVVIDRFRGDDGAPLAPPPNPGARAGGTLDGVRAELEAGSFDELGVTALWLSPVYVNPTEPRAGRDGRMYEGYHGYWPLDSLAVDERLGGEAALEAVVAAAHERGIRVLFDLVPNHVYETNPRYLQHADDGWFNPAGCVCGEDECPWALHLQTCWFTPYLPDVRWQHPEPMRQSVQDAIWWMNRFDADGVRVDAVPMMPRATTRRIAHGLRSSVTPARSTFMVGEVFTGPGAWGISQLRYHLGASGFDSLFDFPLMWALHEAFARPGGALGGVEHILEQTEKELAGSGAVMARMLDNHDTPRFISVAQGDAWGDPWDQPAVQPTDPRPYTRQRLALAAVFTLPGLPVIFQGDEIGLAGAADPDCRRVLPATADLSPEQLSVRETVTQLAQVRACSAALRQGDRSAVLVSDSVYGYVRGTDQPHPVVVLLTNALTETTGALPAASAPAGSYVDAFDGETFELTDGASTSVPLQPLSFRVLLSADDPCLGAGGG